MKKRLLSLFAAFAITATMSACQAADTQQETQLDGINTDTELISKTSQTDEPFSETHISAAMEQNTGTANDENINKHVKSLTIEDTEITNNTIEEISLQKDISDLTVIFYNENSQNELSIKPLASLEGLKRLRLIGYCSDLSIIAEMKSLESIELGENFSIKDLDDLCYNENVKELIITSSSIENIDNIVQLPNLEKITIENTNSIENIDLSALGKMKKLKSICLKWITVDSIEFVNNLENLEEILIWPNNSNISDYENLKYCSKLKEARLYGIDIDNLDFLTELYMLTDLELRWGNIKDLSSFPEIKSLRRLELWGIEYNDILNEMSDLEQLTIYETDLSEEEINKLKSSIPNCEIKY